MRAFWSGSRCRPWCRLGLLLLVVLCSGTANAEGYLDTPGRAARAVEVLVGEMGRAPQFASVRIGADAIEFRVQGDRASDIDAWSVSLFDYLFFDRDWVSGPSPVQPDGIVANVASGFFDLEGVAVADVAEVGRRAIDRAALEDPAAVTSIVIERSVTLLPDRAYGDVRWTIDVRSERETATVYADVAGNIVAADLSGTNRARELDLFTQDDWPVGQAEAQLAAVLGTGESVHEVRFYDFYIYVEADAPGRPEESRTYSWDYSGVKRGLMDTPNFHRMAPGDTVPFRFAEIDLDILPALKAAARSALGMPNGRITSIWAKKSAAVIGPPALQWTVEITDANREQGRVIADAAGNIVTVLLPPSRRPKEPWLAPATLAKTMRRLEETFGPSARFTRILINDETARAEAEDPTKPGALATFRVTADEITRDGAPFDTRIPEELAFTLAELKPLDEARFADFAGRTLQRMQLDGAEVFRYTIWRQGIMVASRKGLPIVEVRAGKNQGWIAGWVVFELDGTEIDVVLP